MPGNFVRGHKSFILQFDKIDMLEGNRLKLAGHEIPIGHSYRNEVLKLLGS